jgi:chaperonin cofactor prefoldin
LEVLDISLTKLERTLETLQEKSLITEDGDAYTTTGVALFEQETEQVTGDDHTEISTDVSEQDAINIAKNELTNAPNDITKLYYPYYTAGKRVFDGVTREEI